jgi:hypothetical protein
MAYIHGFLWAYCAVLPAWLGLFGLRRHWTTRSLAEWNLEHHVAILVAFFATGAAGTFFHLSPQIGTIAASLQLSPDQPTCGTQFAGLGCLAAWASLYAYALALNVAWLAWLVSLPITCLTQAGQVLGDALVFLWRRVLQPGLDLVTRLLNLLSRAIAGTLCLALATALWQYAADQVGTVVVPAACVGSVASVPQCTLKTKSGFTLAAELWAPLLALGGAGFAALTGVVFFLDYVLENAWEQVRTALFTLATPLPNPSANHDSHSMRSCEP